MLTRLLFPRVERWVNGLDPAYRNQAFIRASLGLFRIVGLPTDFSTVIDHKYNKADARMNREVELMNKHKMEVDRQAIRRDELDDLDTLLS